jgi:hypothetical protein
VPHHEGGSADHGQADAAAVNIFVISVGVSGFEESWSVPEATTFERELADKYVEKMETRLARRNLVYEAIQAHLREWDTANPRPKAGANQPPMRPKLPHEKPKKNMTETERAEREAAKLAHAAAMKEYIAPYQAWAEKRYEEQERFTALFTEQEQADLKNMNKDQSWEIIEVEVLE